MLNAVPMMPQRFRHQLRILVQRLRRSRGVSAVEYGLMLACIMCVIIGSVASLGTTLFQGIYNAMTVMAGIT